MPSNPKSILSLLLPTNHRLILERLLIKFFDSVHGNVLICGSGHNPYSIFRNANSITTIDIDKSLNVDYVADIHDLPFKDSHFDSVIAIEVLEHCRDPDIALSECLRVLKSGGFLLVSTPFLYHLHADPHDFFRLSRSYYLDRLSSSGKIKILNYGSLIHIIFDSISSCSIIFIPLRILSYIISYINSQPRSEKFTSGYIVGFTKN